MTEEMKEIIRKQVHEIVDIVLDGNGFEDRTRRDTGTLPTLFMYFSGHVNKLTVQLHVDGWQSGVYYDREWDARLDEPMPDGTIESLRAAIEAAINKKESEVLERDIARKEQNIADSKKELKNLKKALLKKKTEEKGETV